MLTCDQHRGNSLRLLFQLLGAEHSVCCTITTGGTTVTAAAAVAVCAEGGSCGRSRVSDMSIAECASMAPVQGLCC